MRIWGLECSDNCRARTVFKKAEVSFCSRPQAHCHVHTLDYHAIIRYSKLCPLFDEAVHTYLICITLCDPDTKDIRSSSQTFPRCNPASLLTRVVWIWITPSHSKLWEFSGDRRPEAWKLHCCQWCCNPPEHTWSQVLPKPANVAQRQR